MRPAFLVFGSIVCLALSGPVFAAELNTEAIDLNAARENPQLRSYFAQLYLESSSVSQYRTGVLQRDREAGLEQWQRELIDMQIDQFVLEIYRKTAGLEEHWRQLDRMRTGDYDPTTWKSELRELEKQASNLRGKLKAVFPDLSEKKSEEMELEKTPRDPGSEILLIGKEVTEVRKTLSELLFQPTFVTSVLALREGSPLDFLKRISTVARAMRESM